MASGTVNHTACRQNQYRLAGSADHPGVPAAGLDHPMRRQRLTPESLSLEAATISNGRTIQKQLDYGRRAELR